jgi:UDP-galactopyranose mutase
LFAHADVVFTSGHALYGAKRARHRNIHPVPSGVDVAHFASGRVDPAPADQRRIARPRIGFCGAIDDRVDLGLVDAVAAGRPDWHIVLIGPVAADAASRPRRANVHELGIKPYDALPAYFAGWDAAILPFARTEATRDLNPPQTLDYLAAGCPVVSTPIRDVARLGAEQPLVQVADGADEFIAAIGRALAPGGRAAVGRARSLLNRMSWDVAFQTMRDQIDAIVRAPEPAREPVVATSTALVPIGLVTSRA